MNSKLIILHGWAYSTEKWEPFLRLLKDVGIEYEMLKIPGLTTPLKRIWTLDDYLTWLDQKVVSYKLPVILLGHSSGGRIASAFAAKYQGKVSNLILIDSAGIIHRNLHTQVKKSLFGLAAKIGKRITRSSTVRNLFYKAISEQDYNKADPVLKKTMINLISYDLTETFKKTTVPTLIIWGENDKITPLSDGELINRLIQNSEFRIIPGANHSPQFTHPKEVANLAIDFIQVSYKDQP